MSSSLSWRVERTTSTGQSGTPLLPSSGFAGGFTASTTPLGGSLDAAFRAYPPAINLSQRDVLSLTVRFDPAEEYVPLHRGVVVQLGSPRSETLSNYELASARDRLYETIVTLDRVAGADVASMVNTLLANVTLPTGLTWDSADAPTLGFSLGDRFPQLESIGAFLDGLAASVGRFIVPSGTTYVYDGVTYYPGDIVPAVEWGVRGDGSIYFRRPLGLTAYLEEASARVNVEWAQVNAEEVIDAARLVYAADLAGDSLVAPFVQISGVDVPAESIAARPLSRLLGTGASVTTANRRETVENVTPALDYMSALNFTGTSSTDMTNLSNATDGDDTTYAEMSADNGNFVLDSPDLGSEAPGSILRLVYAAADSLTTFEAGHVLEVKVEWFSDVALADRESIYYYNLDATKGERQLVYLPLLPLALQEEVSPYLRVTFTGVQSTRIYEVTTLVPDVDVGGTGSTFLAESFENAPTENVAVIEYYGYLGPTTDVQLLPEGETTPLDLEVKRIEYQVTDDGSFVTRLHTGQGYDGELLAQKAVIDRLAREAITRGRS